MRRPLALLLAALLSAPAFAAKSPPARTLRAAKQGDAAAQVAVGEWYDERGDGKTAVDWYRKSAAQGNSDGLHHMGVMTEGGVEGKGVPQDCPASTDYFQQAVAKGNAASMFRVGYRYYRGLCVTQSYPMAREWFAKSTTAMGEFHLGLMDEFGQGVPVDKLSAATRYERAFARGVIRAANQLGHLYDEWTPRDAYHAYVWYLRGAPEADAGDRKRLASLRKELPADRRRRAETEAGSR